MNSEAFAPSEQVYSNLLNSSGVSCRRESQQHWCFNGNEFDFCINIVLNLVTLRFFFLEHMKK